MPGHQPQFNPPVRDNEVAIGGLTSNIVEHVGERIVLRELTLLGRRLSLLRFGGVAAFARRLACARRVGRANRNAAGSARRARNAGSGSRFARTDPRSLASLGIRTFPARSRVRATGDRIGTLSAGGPRQVFLREIFLRRRHRNLRVLGSHYAFAAFARASSTIMSRRVSRNEQCSHRRHATELVSHGSFSLSSASVMPLR